MKKIALLLCLVLFTCFNLYAFDFAKLNSSNAVASDFTLQDLSGNKVSLSDFAGKPVILFFWTTWCPHCRKAISDFSNKYEDLKKDGIELLAIDVEETKERVESFLKRYSVKYPVLLDRDSDVASDYEILGVPTMILVNKDRDIVSVSHVFPTNYKSLLSK